MGREAAHQMWALAEDAKALVKSLIRDHAMPVTFHPGVAHACWSAAEVRDTHAYAEKLRRDYGYDELEPLDAAGIRRLIGSPVYKGGEVDRGAGHVHPLNYAIGLAQAAAAAGARLHEGSEVHHIQHGAKPVVQTGRGRVVCDQDVYKRQDHGRPYRRLLQGTPRLISGRGKPQTQCDICPNGPTNCPRQRVNTSATAGWMLSLIHILCGTCLPMAP